MSTTCLQCLSTFSCREEAQRLQEDSMADDGKVGIITEYLADKQRTCAIEIWLLNWLHNFNFSKMLLCQQSLQCYKTISLPLLFAFIFFFPITLLYFEGGDNVNCELGFYDRFRERIAGIKTVEDFLFLIHSF